MGSIHKQDSSQIKRLQALVNLKHKDLQDLKIDFRKIDCGTEATVTPLGCAQTHTLDVKQLTVAEWDALLDNWNQRAELMMQTYCDHVVAENCRNVLPIKVSYPPRFSGRTGVNGLPPHLICIEMDITFKCVETL